MGYVSKNLCLVYDTHKIVVEGITGMLKDEYSLIIDSKRVDTVKRIGNAVLHGQLIDKETQTTPIKVEVKKSLSTYLTGGQVGIQAFVEIDGQKYLMEQEK